MTANGTSHATEEATVYVCDLDMFVQVQALKESLAVLWLGKLCEANGYSFEWHPGQPFHLIKNGRNIECKTDNHIPLVVPGVQATDHQTKALGHRKRTPAVGDHERSLDTEIRRHVVYSAFGFTGVITRVMLCRRSEHVDGFGVPGVFDGGVRFWRSGVAVAESWLGGLVDGAGNASFEWLHGVGSQ